MNRKINLIFLSIILIFFSCKKETDKVLQPIDSLTMLDLKSQEYNAEPQISPEVADVNSLIKKIDSKQELRNDGNFNQMTLFEVNKEISLEQLKDYCSSVKPSYTDGYFQILVFFKKPNTARFPDNPITGIYMEEKDSKNIKAIYTINNINGYSKLNYYEKNNWESLVQTVNIN